MWTGFFFDETGSCSSKRGRWKWEGFGIGAAVHREGTGVAARDVCSSKAT